MADLPLRRNVDSDPVPELGPAMRVLPPKWRAAVDYLFQTKGDRSKAALLAGYGKPGGKAGTLHATASRLFGDDRVRAAIKEECLRRIDASEPELLEVVRTILHDTKEKAADRLRAAAMLWDRANPVVNKLQVDVAHHLSSDEIDIQHYRALKRLSAPQDAFLARFGPNGLARVEAMIAAEEARVRRIEAPTIDADYERIDNE